MIIFDINEDMLIMEEGVLIRFFQFFIRKKLIFKKINYVNLFHWFDTVMIISDVLIHFCLIKLEYFALYKASF